MSAPNSRKTPETDAAIRRIGILECVPVDFARNLEAQRDEGRELLNKIGTMTDADNPDSYRSDDREGCLDAIHGMISNLLTPKPTP